eukprot:c2818_g1_i1.p1 GENE.c2818_g1_i1~~c2818_g1_i1.p1  ORF type:complete len:264 (+),score=95.75 c2818_g1_i1:52-843(+)
MQKISDMTFSDYTKKNPHFQVLSIIISPETPMSALIAMEPDDLLEATPIPYKLMMTMFLKQVIDGAKQIEAKKNFLSPPSTTTLQFQQQITSVTAKGFSSSNKIAIDELAAAITNKEQDSSVQLILLDLSWNGLQDIDIQYVKKIFDHVKPKILDLSGNRFHGLQGKWSKAPSEENPLDKCIIEILNTAECVNISANPIASLDRDDFFANIEKNHPEFWKKLIWIPNPGWVTAGAWKCLVANEESQAIVKNTHDEYYSKPRRP